MPDEIKTGLISEQAPTLEQQMEQPASAAAHEARPPLAEVAAVTPFVVPMQLTQIVKPQKDALLIEVEAVLSENISEIYKQLPEQKKALFRQTGEHVAAQVTQMIKGGIMQIKKILQWIRSWLMIIPGVNTFFLEQEAKIKADKINELFARQHAPA